MCADGRSRAVNDPTGKQAMAVPEHSMSRSTAIRALRGLLAASSRSGVLPAAARCLTADLGNLPTSTGPAIADSARPQAPSRGFAAAATGNGGADSSGSSSSSQRDSAWEEVSRLSATATEMAEEGRTEEAKALLKRGKQQAAEGVLGQLLSCHHACWGHGIMALSSPCRAALAGGAVWSRGPLGEQARLLRSTTRAEPPNRQLLPRAVLGSMRFTHCPPSSALILHCTAP